MKLRLTLFSLSFSLIIIWSAALASAQSPIVTFNSLTGIYHLSRDSRGLSLLTTEETIVADFPGGYYGITRSIPKKFQNQSVNIKILNVSDAAGNPMPYKTKTDNNGNLVITTGDPAITLYGSQTIKIRYQTSGVVNLSKNGDEFLLNVNGRGWSQPIGRVDATLYIPASFQAELQGKPGCYTSVNSLNANNCQINIKKLSDATVITSRAKAVSPHQALVLKLNFAPATFTNKHPSINRILLATTITLMFVVIIASIHRAKNTN